MPFPHEAILGLDFFSAQVDAFPNITSGRRPQVINKLGVIQNSVKNYLFIKKINQSNIVSLQEIQKASTSVILK